MKKIILCAICVVAMASCKKETGPQGPAGTNGTNGTNGSTASGSITGKVNQYDQYSVHKTTGLNTTTVSIEGGSNSTVTDAAGNYTLSNVAPGVYNLVFTKAGCGLTKQEQVVFPGNGSLYVNGDVADKPTFTFSTGYVKDTLQFSQHQIRINVNLPAVSQTRSGMVIFGKTSSVDITTPSSYDYMYNFYIQANNAYYTATTSYLASSFNSYTSGQTIYAKVYPSVSQGAGYYDYAEDKNIYTGYGTPLPTTFTLTMP